MQQTERNVKENWNKLCQLFELRKLSLQLHVEVRNSFLSSTIVQPISREIQSRHVCESRQKQIEAWVESANCAAVTISFQ